jgi:hypothetical protein
MKIEGAPTHFAALREIAQRDPISDFNTCYWREVDRVRIDCRFILSRRSRSARVQDRCLPLAVRLGLDGARRVAIYEPLTCVKAQKAEDR